MKTSAAEGIEYRVIMESGNVELSARYVEAGIGISFATIVKGLDPLKGRRLTFIPMTKYLGTDYLYCTVKLLGEPGASPSGRNRRG